LNKNNKNPSLSKMHKKKLLKEEKVKRSNQKTKNLPIWLNKKLKIKNYKVMLLNHKESNKRFKYKKMVNKNINK